MRVFLGFLLAPLVVPLYFWVVGFMRVGKATLGDMGENALGSFFVTGPYAYFPAFVLGLPVYLFLQSKDLLSWQALAVSGGALGALVVMVLLPVEREQVLWIGLFPGGLSGLVF
ncbi:membrane hypothetical protein [Candidatus Nitrospira nitrosa]|uniref:Uncharacterized protein n=1 Tax=Candidatus Nitrospira nitrosa TaxID=1742972 RepID=A0A0S4L3F7_9BACT|nr:hypothetical protein [Candidatus Nitrospira nitrosa]CUS31245.1 membrane hypothetical protein [Candidatus Nitrospira nitrosa]